MKNKFFNFVNNYLIKNNINNNIFIINKDKLDDIDYKNINIFYIDYHLNNLSNEKIINILKQLYDKINDNCYIFINLTVETLSFSNHEENLDQVQFDLLLNDIFNEILNNNYCIIYKDDNKLILKKNIINIIEKLVNYETKRLQILGEIEFNKLIKLLDENNINYLIYFGNLIGLLRHNNLFIPWDLDIDIIVNTNIDILLQLFNNYKIYYNNSIFIIIFENKFLMKIDFFYNDFYKNKINFFKFKIINNYKVPITYDYFEENYKDYNFDFINICNIYTDTYLNRWDNTIDHNNKIILSTKKCNDILEKINDRLIENLIEIYNELINKRYNKKYIKKYNINSDYEPIDLLFKNIININGIINLIKTDYILYWLNKIDDNYIETLKNININIIEYKNINNIINYSNNIIIKYNFLLKCENELNKFLLKYEDDLIEFLLKYLHILKYMYLSLETIINIKLKIYNIKLFQFICFNKSHYKKIRDNININIEYNNYYNIKYKNITIELFLYEKKNIHNNCLNIKQKKLIINNNKYINNQLYNNLNIFDNNIIIIKDIKINYILTLNPDEYYYNYKINEYLF